MSYILRPSNPVYADDNLSVDLSLSCGQTVELYMFDVDGNIVSTIFKGWLSEGNHRMQWNTDIHRGIYFIHVKSESVNRICRLLFLE